MTIRQFFRYSHRLGLKPLVTAAILGLQLAGTVLEGAGLAMLLPVFQYIQAGSDVAVLAEQSQFWRFLAQAYGILNLPINLGVLLATSLFCILSRQCFVFLRLMFMARVQETVVVDVRNLCFQRYLRASSRYHDRELLGSVVDDLTTELRGAVATLAAAIVFVGYAVVTAFYGVLLFVLSPAMTVAALGVILLSVYALRGLLQRSDEVGRAVTSANQEMSGFLVERLRAARLIRLSGTEEAEADAMKALTGRQRDSMVAVLALLARIEVIMEPVVLAAGFTLLYVGIRRFNLRIEEIGLFLVVVVRLLPVVKEMMRTRQSVLSGLGSLEAIDHRLANMEAAQEPVGGRVSFEGLRRAIRFESVKFSYGMDNGRPALDGVTFEVPASKMTALVGPSGSGKSTLIDLLPRLREPAEGTVLFDVVPITEFTLQSLRSGIAYVPQAPQMFNVTASQHIRYGRPGATDAEIRQSARLAGAAEFIEALPEGYDTMLGESGVRLSGGQRQRLDLARALIRRSPVLILDEPMSHLDADSEEQLRQALRQIRETGSVTIIIVGHSLASVADADSIVVLNQGRLEAQGTHGELMAGGGWYAQAFTKQQLQSVSR